MARRKKIVKRPAHVDYINQLEAQVQAIGQQVNQLQTMVIQIIAQQSTEQILLTQEGLTSLLKRGIQGFHAEPVGDDLRLTLAFTPTEEDDDELPDPTPSPAVCKRTYDGIYRLQPPSV